MAASAAQLHITQQLMVRPAGRGQREGAVYSRLLQHDNQLVVGNIAAAFGNCRQSFRHAADQLCQVTSVLPYAFPFLDSEALQLASIAGLARGYLSLKLRPGVLDHVEVGRLWGPHQHPARELLRQEVHDQLAFVSRGVVLDRTHPLDDSTA